MTQKKEKIYAIAAAIIMWILILVWLYYKIVIQGYDRGLILSGFSLGILFSFPFYLLKKVYKD